MPKRFELSEKGIMEALEFLGAELPRKKVSEIDIIKNWQKMQLRELPSKFGFALF